MRRPDGSGVFFSFRGEAVETGEYVLGPRYDEAERMAIGTYSERIGDQSKLHLARTGTLRIDRVTDEEVSGTFAFSVDEYLVLDRTAGRQYEEDLQRGETDLTLKGSFTARIP